MNKSKHTSYKVESTADGRQLVIPDIHGCLKTFEILLDRVNYQKEDQLFLLGDYINRGPESAGVLEFIIDLGAAGYQVFPLRGNHEQMALDSHNRKLTMPQPQQTLPRLQKRKGLVDKNGLLLPKFYQFMNALPYYYELTDYYLVHAGFNFEKANPFVEYDAMMWIKDFIYDAYKAKGKTIIHGHVSTPYNEIEKSVKNRNRVICLDNGCYRKSVDGLGNLCCLDLTNDELIKQRNIEI